MPIARIEAIHVRVPFRRPLLDATGEYTHRRTWLLRFVDEAGHEGFGEAALSPTADDVTAGGLAALVRETVPRLVRDDSPAPADLVAEGEPGRALLAAISGASLGLEAAAAGAGDGPEVAVSATIAFGGPSAGAEAAAQAVELGFETLELRAGFERRTDQLVDRLRAIRAEIGPRPRLRLAVGGAWDLDTATERLAGIEPYRLEYVAQPLAAWDLAGHATLRERSRVPIALDESLDSEGSVRAALAERAADVLVIRPARVGGADVVQRLERASNDAGGAIVLGTYFESGVGIAAALQIAGRLAGPRAHGLATAGLLTHDLLRTPIAIEKGRMRVPQTIELDEDEVARRAVERFEDRR